ncbi:MAG TPA: VOC family protein [Victivallales bacterium]|mgnify:CR=1 FL=1|nr:VOC family protein [Victivallales bacterium]HPO90680.1 VOC family protein [Victivallales bacterium]HRR28983.1 VOC family protein [Victivallales bacterium]HRU00419.1 VOC family protein [Victivallales bacterium]
MNNDEHKSMIYGVVIRTKNIDNLRNFYRDVLDLGPPVVDSNYWVEFKLGDTTHLVLELIDDESENLAGKSGNIDWVFRVDNLEEKKQILAEKKLEPVSEEAERFGKRVLIYRDPDGNLIHIISEM